MNRPLLLTGIGAGVVVVAIGLNLILLNEEAEETPLAQQQAAQKEKASAQEAISVKGDVPEIKPEKPAEAPSPPAPPSFDVARINPKGDTVIAGRAAPNSVVAILDGGKEIGVVTADKRGEWVFVPDKPLPPGNRFLSLEMRIEGQQPMASEDVVVVVAPEKDKDIAGRKATKDSQALALLVAKDGSGDSTVMQKPSATEEMNAYVLAVDVVGYDESGKLFISGRADAGAIVHVYLDNKLLGRADADGEGAWRLRPAEAVAPGDYALRADQLDEKLKVLARVELPFTREAAPREKVVSGFFVVQPGNSLWVIARNAYGKGLQFSVIYEANKDQIMDPDLIYPGQVFTLPPAK